MLGAHIPSTGGAVIALCADHVEAWPLARGLDDKWGPTVAAVRPEHVDRDRVTHGWGSTRRRLAARRSKRSPFKYSTVFASIVPTFGTTRQMPCIYGQFVGLE